MQFYPNDWLAEPSVRSCSLAARGLWIDMLSLMHLSPRRGYLLAATGNTLTPSQLARLTGCEADECSRLLAELLSSGAYSCTDDGTIYSRRMVKDEAKRQKCSEAGRKGGGNPTLKGHSPPEGTFKGLPKGAPKGGSKGGSKPPETRDQRPEVSPSEIRGGEPPLKVPVPGRKPPSGPHADALAGFSDRWQALYGKPYTFSFGKDGPAVSWMLEQAGGLGDLLAVFDRFFADRTEFVTQARHVLGLLRSQFSKWTVDQMPSQQRPPPGRPQTKQQQADAFLAKQMASVIDPQPEGPDP